MSTPANQLPGHQTSVPPPAGSSSIADELAEKTGTTPAATTPGTGKSDKAPETLAADLDADERSLAEKHGPNWGIKAYREEKKQSAKYKDLREVAERIGNPEVVRQGLALVEVLGDPTSPIEEAMSELRDFDGERYAEMRNAIYTDFIDNHADHMLADIIGVRGATVAKVKAALDGTSEGTKTTTAAKSGKGAYSVPEDLKDDYPEAAEMLETLQAELAELKGQKTTKVDEPDQTAELRRQLDTLKNHKQREAYLEEVQTEGAALYQDAYAEVDAALQELGLAPDKDDPEELADLKSAARDYLSDQKRVEAAFDAVEENVKLADRVTEHLARKQFKRAKQYVPTIKVGIRAAVEALATERKGKALVDAVKRELQGLAKSGSNSNRGGKGPLIGSQAAGAEPPKYTHGKGDDDLWDQMENRIRERKAQSGR